nr:T9SS type A sorting domain-containing protein [uncultured Fluviicola sp.]
MKKSYLILSMLSAMLATFNSYSQTYSGYGSTPSNDDYNYVDYSSDTMYYTFNSLPNGAYEDAILTIDGDAYFNPGSSYNIYGPGLVLVGSFTPPIYTCDYIVTTITIPFADINAYGGSVVYKFVKQGTVYPYCNNNRFRTKLQYKYCPTGVPVQQASFSLTDHVFCRSEGPFNLVGSPAGGTFSGMGVANNTLDLSTLPNGFGVYNITYTLTEANGCYTQDSAQFSLLENPADESKVVCENAWTVLDNGTSVKVYATDLSLSNVIGTGNIMMLPPITSNPMDLYTAIVSVPYQYELTAIDTNNFQTVDHDQISGDDRGGMAVTANYVYIVGDDATARFDLDLQNGIDLPKRDGIFTNLASLKLYTLYNTNTPTTPNNDNTSGFTMNALRSLNEDLSLGTEIIMLSEPITVGVLNQGVMLAGYNELIVGTAYGSYDFYHISILNGLVTPMGQHNLNVQGSENWADWGMAGFDGTDRHAYFRDDNDSIVDFNFTTNTATAIFDITDLSDMASFIVHPTNNRFYGHYEGSTTTFGGNDETLLYFEATDMAMQLTPTSENFGCPNKITFMFNTIDLGADTTVCSEDGLYIIPGGFGYSSYTWNGVNNNFNSYAVQNSQQVVLSVIDGANCTLTDTVNVTVTPCSAGITELDEMAMQIYPVPNNGTFQINFNALTEEAQIHVIDAQGKQVASKTVSQGETTVDMNLEVQPGIYFVRLVSENGTTQRAVSIQ